MNQKIYLNNVHSSILILFEKVKRIGPIQNSIISSGTLGIWICKAYKKVFLTSGRVPNGRLVRGRKKIRKIVPHLY